MALGKLYGKFFQSLANKEVDFNSDTLKLALFTVSHVPDRDAHQYFDVSCTTNQVPNGSGYTTGGNTVSPGSMSYNSGTGKLSFDVGDTSWTSATFTCRYAILYDDTPGSNKPLVLYVDFVTNQVITAGSLAITWDTTGCAYIQVGA